MDYTGATLIIAPAHRKINKRDAKTIDYFSPSKYKTLIYLQGENMNINTDTFLEAIYPTPPSEIHFAERDGIVTYDSGESCSVGELVTDYANLVLDKRNEYRGFVTLILEIGEIINKSSFKKKNTAIYKAACKYGGPVFARTIVLLVYEAYRKAYYEGIKFNNYFGDRLTTMVKMCKNYINGSELETTENGITLESHIFTDDTGHLVIEYSSQSASAVLYYHLLRLQELGLHPNICQICGRAFIPVSKVSELYCRKKHSDGRTCAEIAVAKREKDDPFYHAYKRAYKKLFARMTRGDSGAVGKRNLDEWTAEATRRRKEYKERGDLAGYIQWVEETTKLK